MRGESRPLVPRSQADTDRCEDKSRVTAAAHSAATSEGCFKEGERVRKPLEGEGHVERGGAAKRRRRARGVLGGVAATQRNGGRSANTHRGAV